MNHLGLANHAMGLKAYQNADFSTKVQKERYNTKYGHQSSLPKVYMMDRPYFIFQMYHFNSLTHRIKLKFVHEIEANNVIYSNNKPCRRTFVRPLGKKLIRQTYCANLL